MRNITEYLGQGVGVTAASIWKEMEGRKDKWEKTDIQIHSREAVS